MPFTELLVLFITRPGSQKGPYDVTEMRQAKVGEESKIIIVPADYGKRPEGSSGKFA